MDGIEIINTYIKHLAANKIDRQSNSCYRKKQNKRYI